MALRMVRDLQWKSSLPQMGGLYFNEASTLGSTPKFQPFDRERAMHEFLKLNEQLNFWEERRCAR